MATYTMNFSELLEKHNLDESEYNKLTESLHGISMTEFRRSCPIEDWLCAAFPFGWSTNRLQYAEANREWVSFRASIRNKPLSIKS